MPAARPSRLSRFHQVPAGESRLRWLGWHLVHGLVANTLIAVAITVIVPYLGTFGQNLIYSHCIGFAIRLLVMAVAVRRPLDEPHKSWKVIVTVVLATAAGLLIGSSLAAWIIGTPVFFLDPIRRQAYTAPILTITALASIAGTLYFWSREHVARLKAQAEADHARAERASRQASDAELRMVRAQLEPHMLFNTLANLRALMTVDPAAAQTMLDRLIAFLRATLSASRRDRVSLGDEFALVADYLELMAVRMGPRLTRTLDLPAELSHATVLPMLLQPIVENAIKHGLEPSIDGGDVTVRARRDGARLVIDVDDTGVGLATAVPQAAPAPSVPRSGHEGGFGLAQIRERLQTAYGDQASVALVPNPVAGRGARVTLRLPLQIPGNDLEPRSVPVPVTDPDRSPR